MALRYCTECGEQWDDGNGYRPHTPWQCRENVIDRLRRQLAAANERVAELEKELAERGKDIVFYSELRDSAVGSLAKLEAALVEWEDGWFGGGPKMVAANNKLRELLIEMGIIDRILGGGK